MRNASFFVLFLIILYRSERIFEMSQYFLWVVAAPIQVLTTCALICVLLGWPGVPSFAIVGIVVFVNRQNGILVGKVRRSALPVTDSRLGLIQELISAVKIVKIYLFESSLSESVLAARNLEINTLKRANLIASLTASLVQGNGVVTLLVCLVLYVGTSNVPLSASTAFTVLSLVNGLWFPMHMLGLGLTRVGVGLQSFDRLSEFLNAEELPAPERLPSGSGCPELTIDNAVFRHDQSFEVRVDYLHCSIGLHMIVGSIGSGKSTLLMGSLGLMEKSQGNVSVRGTVSYAAQNAFITNASVKNNILFGDTREFDEERYQRALQMSCLNVDLFSFVDGDRTEIGEKGINLSGGQRQRVSVARAIYSDSEIIIFDDCLSAVDVRVGKIIFASLKELAKTRVVLLANHQLQHCNSADQIIVLEKGKIIQVGNFDELSKEGALKEMLANYGQHYEEEQEEKKEDLPVTITDSTPLEQEEKKNTDAPAEFIKSESSANVTVKKNVWIIYLESTGVRFICAILGLVLYMAIRTFTDFWLAAFVNGNNYFVSFNTWAAVYGSLAGAALILFYFSDLNLFWSCLTASQKIHDSSFSNLLRGTMHFFDTTPIGRILNRYSKDVDTLDNSMPFAMEQLVIYSLQSLSIFVAIAVVAPLILSTFPALFLLFFLVARFLRSSNRQSRRILAVSKSLVFGTVATIMNGMHTIRAFSRIHVYQDQLKGRINDESAAVFFSWMLARWFNLRLDVIVSFLLFLISIISATNRNGALGSLAISYTIRLASAFQWSIRNALDVESQMISAERLNEYADSAFPMEPASGIAEPPESWPRFGEIEFDDVTVFYGDSGKAVLSNVSFTVRGGASLGVVGRTGAGKTTLMSCLLRLIPYRGTIRIDGVDISTVSLARLRGAISVIPQEAVVFNGSLKKNLDPANSKSSDAIESVMRALKLDGMCGKLEEAVGELSQGQRQLLCIARAVLHGGHVLISDESTASIDTATDQHIQRFLESFLSANRVTSLTIAHRLQTVITADLVLVLHKGRLAEFGPTNAIASRGGRFRGMIEDTGRASSAHLLALASHKQVAKEREKSAFERKQEEGEMDAMAMDFDLLQCRL